MKLKGKRERRTVEDSMTPVQAHLVLELLLAFCAVRILEEKRDVSNSK